MPIFAGHHPPMTAKHKRPSGHMRHMSLVHWKKSPAALFRNSSFATAGKRLLLRILRSQHSHIHVQQRGFCQLPRASLFVATPTGS
jgi:hypothetical protein